MVRWSVTLPEVGLGQYVRVFTDPVVLSVMMRTLRVCVLVTLFTVAIAYVLSFVAMFGGRTARTIVTFGVLIPFWISTLTRAFGWLALLFNRGIVNTALMDLGVVDFPLTLVRNELGVVIGMTHFLVPFAVLPLTSSMRQIDGRVLMAARGMGAGRVRTFWAVLMPMTTPGILGAAIITFIFALGFFITPAILGGGAQRDDRRVHLRPDLPDGELGARWRDLGGPRRCDGAADGAPPAAHQGRKARRMIGAYRPGPVALALAALAILFLLAPLIAVVPISLTPTRYLSLPTEAFSLQHYRALIEEPQWGQSALLSVLVGLMTSAIATALATLFALGIWLVQPRLAAPLVGFVLLPMIVPPVVSAMTLYFLLTSISQVSAAVGYDTWPGVVLAHVVNDLALRGRAPSGGAREDR